MEFVCFLVHQISVMNGYGWIGCRVSPTPSSPHKSPFRAQLSYTLFFFFAPLFDWFGMEQKEIGEDLRRLDLMRPWRSTVEERGIAPSPDLGLKEVADDIRAIGWQECPIGSILAVRSGLPSHPKATEDAKELKRKNEKKKKKKMRAAEQAASVEAESSTSAVAADEAMKKKKKKRTMLPFPRMRGQVMPAHACG